jgi:hypothetical protein
MSKTTTPTVYADIKEDNYLGVFAKRLYEQGGAATWGGLSHQALRERLREKLAPLQMQPLDAEIVATKIEGMVRDEAPPSGDERRRQQARLGGQGLPF